jgi:hypothetical protein
MKSKLLFAALIGALAILMPTTVNAADKAGDALRKEYNELQPKMHECMVAIEKAVRNNNIWQEENLTMEECKARGYQSIDLGNRMLQYGISPAAIGNQHGRIAANRAASRLR